MIPHPQEDIDKWKETMKDYKESKTKLRWGANPRVTYVGERDKKLMDQQYDPILQRYRDPPKEDAAHQEEQQQMTHTLAKNKVPIVN